MNFTAGYQVFIFNEPFLKTELKIRIHQPLIIFKIFHKLFLQSYFKIARIISSEGSNFRFHITIDGKTFEKIDSKDKNYAEVHTSCLSKLLPFIILKIIQKKKLQVFYFKLKL